MPSLPRLLENDCLFSRQFNPENPLTHLPFGSRLITFAAKEKLKLLLSKQRYSEAFQLLRGLLKIRFYKPKAFWKVCAEIVQHLAPYDLAGFLYAAFISSSASNGMVILETWINCLLNSDRTQEALEELDRLIDIQPYNTNVELWRIYAMLKFTEWKEKADAIKFQSETNSGDENEDEDEDEEEDDEDIEDRKKRLNYPAATRLLSIVSKASEMVPGDTQLRGAQLELLQYLKDFKNKTNLMRRIYRYAISRRDPGQMSLLLYYWPETEIGSSEWKRVAVSVCNWDPIANVNVALRPLIENLKKCLPGKHVHVDSSHKNQFLVHKYPRTLQNSSDKNQYKSAVRRACFAEVSAWIMSFHLLLDRLAHGSTDKWTLHYTLKIVEFYIIMQKLPRYSERKYITEFLLEDICNRDMETPLVRLIDICKDEPHEIGNPKIAKIAKILEYCAMFRWHYKALRNPEPEEYVPTETSDPFLSPIINEIEGEVWEEMQDDTPEKDKARRRYESSGGRTEEDIIVELQDLFRKKIMKKKTELYTEICLSSEDEYEEDSGELSNEEELDDTSPLVNNTLDIPLEDPTDKDSSESDTGESRSLVPSKRKKSYGEGSENNIKSEPQSDEYHDDDDDNNGGSDSDSDSDVYIDSDYGKNKATPPFVKRNLRPRTAV